jgi:thymidylate synthase (FAD)
VEVKLVWRTDGAESLVAYCARVSSDNQENPDYDKLLRYCVLHGHWSVFEMANMCVEIITSRAISAQILRHRSFSFQEFSQRYAAVQLLEPVDLRLQDDRNRQNSFDTMDSVAKANWTKAINQYLDKGFELYGAMLDGHVAKECARMVLPMTTQTKLYMNGTLRSWIHYLELRTDEGTQKEHREIAWAIKKIFTEEFPTISGALCWEKEWN